MHNQHMPRGQQNNTRKQNADQQYGRRNNPQELRSNQNMGSQQFRTDWNSQSRGDNSPNRYETEESHTNYGTGGRPFEELDNEMDRGQYNGARDMGRYGREDRNYDYNASSSPRGFEGQGMSRGHYEPNTWDRPENLSGRKLSEPFSWPRFGSQGGASNEGLDDQNNYGNTYGSGSNYGLGYQEQGAYSTQGRDTQTMRGAERFGKGPKGYKRADERIKDDVCDRICHMRGMDASDVEIQVSGGEVTLTGTIQTRQMKWQLEHLIDSINGVTEIHNQLRMKRDDMSSSKSDMDDKANKKTSMSSPSASHKA